MERVDGYVRVSRVGGRSGPSYISPSVQREQIERWASYKQVEIAAWHVDEDESGGAASRPGLDAAVRRCLNGETGGIVSVKIDRFSRLTEQGLRDLRRLSEVGARLAFVVEDVDTAQPIGRLVYTVMLAQAEYFLEQIRSQWAQAKTRAVNRGAHIGPTPLGFNREPDGTLRPSEDAEGVAEAFRLAAGGSLGRARTHLEARFPERTWTMHRVRRLLASRVYLGEVRYGEMVREDAHPAIVSQAVWEAAQSSPAPRTAAADFPLSGALACGSCGNPLVGGRGGKGQRTYRCSASLALYSGERCPKPPSITATIIEGYVLDWLRALLAGGRTEMAGEGGDRLALAERALTEAEAELDAFAADLTLRRALGGRYQQHLNARVKAVETAREKYRELARKAHAGQVVPSEEQVDGLSGLELRELLGSIGFTVVVSPGRGGVESRVRFVPDDADDPAGVAAGEDAF